jgi:exportin-5
VLTDLASIRSEKKAANRVKEMLLQAAGGPDALRAFAEAKAAATSVGAIQVPVVQAPRAAAAAAAAAAGVASQTWSEEDVNAIGLNPLTANVRATQ